MASHTSKPLIPQIVPFPKATWRAHMVPEEWAACLDAWISLVEAHLSLSPPNFQLISVKDDSVSTFLLSYVSEAALAPDSTSFVHPPRWKNLWKQCFLLSNRLVHAEQPPGKLLGWEFLSDFCRVYGKVRSMKTIADLWTRSEAGLEGILAALKISLVEKLEAGIKGSPAELGQVLKRLNHLLFCSPNTASFFMTGSDFLDGLVSCYKLMNPPLRKAIISTAYLSILGLTEGPSPSLSLLIDQLYSLKSAADLHKAGPTDANDSLVPELVTVTPLLKQIEQRIENDETISIRAESVVSSLKGFRKVEGGRSKRFVKRKIREGKRPAPLQDEYDHRDSRGIYIHRMSLITQVQDLFPDLGSRFVTKLLDEYDEDTEQVISHLLEGTLPTHLRDADHVEVMTKGDKLPAESMQDLAPRLTPPLLPTRRNIFDNDELDELTVDTSRLHFGRRDQYRTADDILTDRTTAPNKAAILSALVAFDSDDDERDDTYDVEDVGGTVDPATPGNNPEEAGTAFSDTNEEDLFRAFKMTPRVFDRDAATRRSKSRIILREAIGITDEAIEGWALMLSRDPQRMKRLETRFSDFSSAQMELVSSAWKADPGGSGAEESDSAKQADRGANIGRRGRGGRRREGTGRDSSVTGPAGEREIEIARQRKEVNKSARANHNRKDQRARKMARGGFRTPAP